MNRLKGNTTISLNINRSVQNLSILIENQGRINYGDFIEDRKVIIYLETYLLNLCLL